MAAMQGMCLVKDLGIRAMILEGMPKQLWSVFKITLWTYLIIILPDAFRIAQWFDFFSAQYVLRNCNIVANNLVELAKDRINQDWTIRAPHNIKDILAQMLAFE